MIPFVSESKAGLASAEERSQDPVHLAKRWRSQKARGSLLAYCVLPWWLESMYVDTCANPSGRTFSISVSEYMSAILQNKIWGNFPPASTEILVSPTTEVPGGLVSQKWQDWDDLVAWPASPFSSGLSPGLCKGSYKICYSKPEPKKKSFSHICVN